VLAVYQRVGGYSSELRGAQGSREIILDVC
jgi:hypothetical protein